MKTISYFTALIALILLGCKREIQYSEPGSLVTPVLSFTESDNPYTGLLAVYPCQTGSSIYFGNYTGGKLSAINASYVVSNGQITKSTPPLTLPTGSYQLVYWGISKAIDVAYENPGSVEPPMTIGVDTKKLDISLRQNRGDTTYMPTFDYVFSSRATIIGNQGLSVPLQRSVAGLKVTVRRENSQQLDPTIDSLAILVSDVAGRLNLYDASPSDFTRTVAFGLTISGDRMSATNNLVTLFPSVVTPRIAIVATLNSGKQKIYRTTLSNILTAGVSLNISVDMGEIFIQETTGNGFTVSGWDERTESITTGPF